MDVDDPNSSPSLSTYTEGSLKRKERDHGEEQQAAGEQKEGEKEIAELTSDTSVEAAAASPKKKKAKNTLALVKKVAVWKDIKKWKQGDDPLGRFPIEILDQIISIDSDLDLRDHLALAGTCRYFRSCYRDVVFQVLYHSKNPNSRLPVHSLSIGEDGTCSTDQYYSSSPNMSISFVGPVSRGWNVARKIFSSGSFSQDGWGVSNEEWEELKKEKQAQEREELSKYLELEREGRREGFRIEVEQQQVDNFTSWKKRKEEYDTDVAAHAQARIDAGLPPAHGFWIREPSTVDIEKRVQQMLDSLLYAHTRVYGSWLDPRVNLPSDVEAVRDPWESPWRAIVVEVVNKPKISRSDAKSIFKVSDRELLSLPLVKLHYWKKGEGKHFRRTAVEALALRSHGGVFGHDDYLEKLKVRKEKAHDTRVKNGTLQVPKPKPPKPPKQPRRRRYYL